MGRTRKGRGAPSLGPDEAAAVRIRERLVAWYGQGHRDLPWRADHDPYRILVAETMLVQTTVAAVVPYYERFLRRFPTVQDLAAAEPDAVVKAWEGLGYYRRARQLHAAARAIVAEHGGRVPEDLDTLQALPGVGRYIAGAVLSFAFDRPAPIVEANTRRVLARLLAWREDLDTSASRAALWDLAGRLVPERGAGTFNQALMELGATLCAPNGPRCLLCPIAGDCRAFAEGLQDDLPLVAARPRPLAVEEVCVVVERLGRWLVVQRGPAGLWPGFWEFPTIHRSGADPAARAWLGTVTLEEGVERLTGVPVRVGEELGTVRYTVTKHRVALTAFRGEGLAEATAPAPGLVAASWFQPEDLAGLSLGSAMRKLVAGLLSR